MRGEVGTTPGLRRGRGGDMPRGRVGGRVRGAGSKGAGPQE